jgi:hypothetical protein
VSILRQGRRANYTVIGNAALRDERLSFKALGLLVFLLSKPDGWTINLKQIARDRSDGYTAVSNAMSELVTLGYAKREVKRGENGHLLGSETTVFEEPIELEKPTEGMSKPESGFPTSVNDSVVSTDLVSTDLVKELKESEKASDSLPVFEPEIQDQIQVHNEENLELQNQIQELAMNSSSNSGVSVSDQTQVAPVEKTEPTHAEMFGALCVQEFGEASPKGLTAANRSLVGKVAKDLREAGYKPENVVSIALFLAREKRFEPQMITLTSIAKYAAEWLNADQKKRAAQPKPDDSHPLEGMDFDPVKLEERRAAIAAKRDKNFLVNGRY